MENPKRLMNQIEELKFKAKTLHRQAQRCGKDGEAQKLKEKKANENGNTDDAKIHAENAFKKSKEQTNYQNLASRLDVIVDRIDTETKLTAVGKSLSNIGELVETILATGKIQKMSDAMGQFERQFEMEPQVENAGGAPLTTAKGEVNALTQQIVDDYNREAGGTPQLSTSTESSEEEVDEA